MWPTGPLHPIWRVRVCRRGDQREVSATLPTVLSCPRGDDPHPVWVTAVLTTHAQALTSATPGDFIPGADGTPVYLVTIRGEFVCDTCTGPAGSKATSGTYISLVVDARTFTGLDFGMSP